MESGIGSASIPHAGLRPFSQDGRVDTLSSRLGASIPHAGLRPFSRGAVPQLKKPMRASIPHAGLRPFSRAGSGSDARSVSGFNPSRGSQAIQPTKPYAKSTPFARLQSLTRVSGHSALLGAHGRYSSGNASIPHAGL